MKQRKIILNCITVLFPLLAFSQFIGGVKFDEELTNSQKVKSKKLNFQIRENDEKLPSAHSMKSFTPVVENQGEHGTCVGWSTAYYGLTTAYHAKQGIQNKTQITENAYSPVYAYLSARESDPDDYTWTYDYNCEKGTFIEHALTSLKKRSNPKFKDFNTKCSTNIPIDIDENNGIKVKDFIRLSDKSFSKSEVIQNIKIALANNHPVLIGMMLDGNFKNINELYRPSTEKVNIGGQWIPTSLGGHAMAIIGYDDETETFEIINSWGTNWGNLGYFKIKYNDLFAKDGNCYVYDSINPGVFNCDARIYELIVENKNNETNIPIKIKGSLMLYPDNKPMELKGGFVRSNSYGRIIRDIDQSIYLFETNEAYKENTKYKMKVESSEPVYVYVLSLDSEGNDDVIFPDFSTNESALLANVNEAVILPAPNISFKLVGEVEYDTSIVLFSSSELNVDDILHKINQSKEISVSDKIYDALSNDLIDKNEFVLFNNKLSAALDLSSHKIACMLIKINRE